MKLCIRKIYCANCKKLVQCTEKKANGGMLVSCPICNTPLWSWNGIRWQPIRKKPAKGGAPNIKAAKK